MGMVARLSLLSTGRMGQRISVATVKIKCWDSLGCYGLFPVMPQGAGSL